MKTLKTMLAAAAGLSLLALAGCSSATGDTPTPAPLPPLSVLDLSGAVDTTNWINTAGWQNSVTTFPALSIIDSGAQSYRSNEYRNGGGGATAWHEGTDLSPAAKELKFTLKAHYSDSGNSSDDCHVLLNLTNLDLTKLKNYTGVTFAVRVPKLSDTDYVANTGFTVLLRQRTVDSENTAVYLANLGDGDAGTGVIGNTSGTQSDWAYWANSNLVVYKVPFDFFREPLWPHPTESDSVASALKAGVVFNSIDLDFRFNRPGSAYTDDTEYPAYVSGVALY